MTLEVPCYVNKEKAGQPESQKTGSVERGCQPVMSTFFADKMSALPVNSVEICEILWLICIFIIVCVKLMGSVKRICVNP